MLRLGSSLIFCSLVLGCGGNVVVDHGAGGNGAGGTGGTSPSGSSVSVSSFDPGSTVGPSSSSSSSVSTGTEASCPALLGIDAFCNIEGQACPMPNACCSTGAVCKNNRWQLAGPQDCHQPCFQCKDVQCAQGSLCVQLELDSGLGFACAANTCPTDVTPTCDNCGEGVCQTAAPLSCGSVQGNMVFCNCPTC